MAIMATIFSMLKQAQSIDIVVFIACLSLFYFKQKRNCGASVAF